MQIPQELSSVTVLVPGKLHAHAAGRIGETFQRITIENSDASLLTDQQRGHVQGIGSYAKIDAKFIDAFPNLKIIANFGVGYDGVDAAYAASKGIIVTHTPHVLDEEVADTTIGLLLNTLRQFNSAENYLRAGRWVKEGNYALTPLTLRGRKIGIFGMGRIGKAVARRLEGFGVSIAYHNRRADAGVAYPYFDSLVGLADAVDTLISIAPSTPETHKIVGHDVLKALGPNGVFINIGRGTTVDELALIAALTDGTIAAAGLDVFYDEPRVPQALIDLPNTCLLPHVGSASVATRIAMADLVVDNLVSYFSKGTVLTPVPECQGFAKQA
jgi:lactate dehydrogenase-like 2-hydroxyacid dehydrogenase